MELSQEIQEILQKYRPQRLSRNVKDDDLIDVRQIDLSNDQTWLVDSESVDDLSTFLICDSDLVISSDSDTPTILNESTRKTFDSRTFTRPKKKLNRPSIEKYNEEYFADDDIIKPSRPSLSDEIDKYISISSTTLEDSITEKPLHFDLSQPINTSIFDKILANTSELDSFQNMSPPSLVNSMCSSTFTNLMENSYIKNDPILREIRDADYSSVIYQESEPPLYQSITESCSSINTEVAETFVRRTLNSLNCTFNKSQLLEESSKANDDFHETQVRQVHTENIDPNATYAALNGTYRKNKSLNKSLNKTFEYETQQNVNINQKINATFDIDDLQNLEFIENERLQIENVERNDDDDIDDHNMTFGITKHTHKNAFNNTYKRETTPRKMNSTFNKSERSNSTITIPTKIDNYMIDADEKSGYNNKSKRLSDEIDEFLTQKLNSSYCKEEKSLNQYSAESTDSLDRLSSISNSSRDSKRMAEVDAIVERQERSLGLQVMSTPKPAKSMNKLFEHAHLSPIPMLNMKEHLSDSEVSSEEYATVRSRFSEQQSARSFRSLNNLKFEGNQQRSIHTINNSNNIRRPDAIRRPSTGGNLRQTSKTLTGSYTNLKTMNSNLKGSYTNLRPRSMVLPNIPPKDSDGDYHPKLQEFKVPQVPATYAREPACNSNGTFVKTKVTSSLPRPVTGTGIPRPASRIPGPRSSRF